MALTVAVAFAATLARFGVSGAVSPRLYKTIIAWMIFLFLGEMTIYTGMFRSILLAPPTAVIWKLQFNLDKGYLQINIAATMQRFLTGFLLAIALGLPLGVVCGFYRRAYQWLSPALNFVRMIPPPAILPFAIIIFGIGEAPGIFVITLGCFFPIFLNTMRGVHDTETLHCEVVRTMGGGKLDVLRHAIIPSAVPSMLTGVRIGFGIGWLVLVSAEIVAADSGLGFMIQGARKRLDTPTVFLGMATICVLGLTIDFLLKKIERFFVLKKRGGADFVYY